MVVLLNNVVCISVLCVSTSNFRGLVCSLSLRFLSGHTYLHFGNTYWISLIILTKKHKSLQITMSRITLSLNNTNCRFMW